MSHYLSYLDWPAMITALAGSWLVGSQTVTSRWRGFALYLVSNGLWAVWGVYNHAWALLIMQVFFTVTSIRGLMNARSAQ